MKKCLLFALSFAVLLTVLYTPFSVKAATPYDDLVQLHQPLILKEANDNEKTKDYSIDWYNFAVAAVKRNCDTGLPATCPYYEYLRDFDFNNPDNNWSVLVNQTGTQFYIITSTNPAANITFQTEYPGQPYAFDYYSINSPSNSLTISAGFSYNESLGQEESDYLYYNGGGSPTTSSQFIINRSDVPSVGNKIFISTFPTVYPEGYNGELIPDTYEPVPDGGDFPDFLRTVDRFNIKVIYLKNLAIPEGLVGGTNFNINYKLYDEQDNLIDEQTLAAAPQVQYPNATYNFDVTNLGLYKMVATAVKRDAPPPLLSPDIPPTVKPTTFQILVNGKSYSSSTLEDNCTADGVCTTELDPATRLIRSMTINLGGMPISGLQQTILQPIAFVASLPSYTENCSPISLPFPAFIGGTLTFPCMSNTYKDNFNAIYVMYQTIISGLVAYWVSIRIFSSVKDIANPKDDRIEVVTL